MTLRRRAALAALASAVVVVAVASRTPQGLYSDPALQLKGVQQLVSGASTHFNTWMRPDYRDLAHDQAEPLIWWAPGTPLATLPLVTAGVPVARAARVIAIASLVAGSIGWAVWFAGFGLPVAVVVTFAALLPWMRFVSNVLFWYSSEILVFAFVPWLLLAALAAERRNRVGSWVALGLFAGALYVVKYSASFVALGLLLWLAWRAWQRKEGAIVAVVSAGIAAALPVAVLTIVNRSSGGSANLLAAAHAGGLDWRNAVYAVALPALGAGDLDSVLRFVLMHPAHSITTNELWLAAIGVPGGLLLLALVARWRVDSDGAALARIVFAASVAAIFAVWTLTPGVDRQARHVASAAFCVLPLAIAEAAAWWRLSRDSVRVTFVAAAAAYLALPLAYGPVSVVAKAMRVPSDYRTASSGLYNPLFAEHDLDAVVGRLERDFNPAGDVWYLTEPLSALDLGGRAIVRDADFMTLADLRADRFVTSRPMRVHALLPPRFEENGKADAIRAAFPQAVSWRHDAVPGSRYDRWIAELRPETGP